MSKNDVDHLYGLPLDQFTAARNELAKRLRKAGDRDEAERIAALRKPSITAWAINQLARRHNDLVAELMVAGAELVLGQRRALAGEGTSAFNAAQERQRGAIHALTTKSRSVLADAGHSASEQTVDRIAASLRAASLDDAGRELLAHGRFEDDFEGPGLSALSAMVPANGSKRKSAARPKPAAASRQQLAAARKRQREAAEAERTARRSADRAGKAAERARAEADSAAEAEREARAELERARAALEQANADVARLLS